MIRTLKVKMMKALVNSIIIIIIIIIIMLVVVTNTCQ
jgi:hypothetical protein